MAQLLGSTADDGPPAYMEAMDEDGARDSEPGLCLPVHN
jgi:hypothetical protein